ncbi:hypothetical protein ACWDAO_38745, partial [Streptomyces sp. NPDC001212]
MAAVVYTVATRRLTGDIHYVLGALRTGGEAGYSPSEVFTHRPFFYRWFIAGLDRIAFGGSRRASSICWTIRRPPPRRSRARSRTPTPSSAT